MSDVRAAIERLYDLSDPFDPVNEAAIEQFESEIGARLPDDYREFLLLHNGGRLHVHTRFGDRYRMPYGGLGLEWLYGLRYGERHSELRWNRRQFRGRIPDAWLMFGDGLTWQHYCVSLRSEDYGMVWVWNREGSDLLPLYKSATCLNCTFAELLGQLQPNRNMLELRGPEAAMEPLRSILLYDLPGLNRHFATGGAADCRDQYQRTPLMYAAEKWPNVVPLLLERGAGVEVRDVWGRTPLRHAVGGRSIDSVRALLRVEADPLAEDKENVTPLIRAFMVAIAESDLRHVTAMRLSLEQRGVLIDYRVIENIAHAERYSALGEGKDNDQNLELRVFFRNNAVAAYIPGSGIVVTFGLHSREEVKGGFYTSPLADLIQLFPKAWAYANDSQLPAVRYEICNRVFRQAAEQIVPQWEGPTCGDFVACLGSLLRTITELTSNCFTREQIFQAIGPAKEHELVACHLEALRHVCGIRYSRDDAKDHGETRKAATVLVVSPREALLLSSPGFSRAVIEGAGFVLSVGPMMRDQIEEPRLDLVVRLGVPQIFPVDSSELDGDPQNPATYARFEICRDIFSTVARQVTVERTEATLDDIHDCVRTMHRALVAESLECRSENEVFAAVSADLRERIASGLLAALKAKCYVSRSDIDNQ